MKQRTFERSHQLQWDNLECWLDNLDKRKRLENQEAVKFPQQYRQVCQHLALARDRHYTPNLIERLNRLVLRGHQHLYRTILFFGSLFIMFIGVQINPKLVYTLMNAEQVHQVEKMYSPTAEHLGRNREADSDFLMFGFYIRNNISIGFQTFAGGILFGLGTLFFIIFNGLYIGCVAGHLTYVGYNVPFYSFVAGHSSVELMAIVLAGAAGLKLGLALIAPGRLTRLQALHHAAIQSMQLVYGVIAMLLLAAFIEAFWSSNATIAPLIKYSVGGLLWFLMITYFIKVGHHHAT